MGRTIIFGDIHGCWQEWEDLLEKIRPTDEDRLIAVGDLVCKGPSTRKVLDIAMSLPKLQCILGNHDLYLLRRWQQGRLNELRTPYQFKAIDQLKPDIDHYMRFIETWPLYLELPECTVIHAGIRPGISLAMQEEYDLTHLRTLEDGSPWYEHYHDNKLIVHGHWARQGLVIRDNAIGLDSGCVYGKQLSAVILPKRKIVSVPARQVYVPI